MNCEAMRLPRVIVPSVEEQGLDVPRRFDRPTAHGEHVALHEAVHAAIPMARQAPMVVGMRQTSRATRMTTETTAWPPLTMSA